MRVDLINAIKLSIATLKTMNIKESPINNTEIELKENFENVPWSAMHNYNELEILQDITLEFQDEFKNNEAIAVEDNWWYKEQTDTPKNMLKTEKKYVFDIKNAVAYTEDQVKRFLNLF